ncbi:MAG: glucoamylase family protein [Candidatus Contendobacter sp.]|nr:glucoamylase family protein [Candidatus Contendobacter sp.]
MSILFRLPLALLGGLLLCLPWSIQAAEFTTAPLLLHDFERLDGVPNLGGTMSGWATAPGFRTGRVKYRLEPASGPDRSRALHLNYRFAPEATGDLGWQITLPDLDASTYDHLEFWIRGDSAVGYADALKIEFKQPLPNAPPGLLRQGSTVVAGITDDWQRIQAPLNRMNGIADWRHLRQFGIVLQPRRSPVRVGAYWLDDIALIKTGDPGPSVRDPVIPPRKTAWENSLGGKAAAQPYIRARLAGWPERLLTGPAEQPADDLAFLWRLARDTWRGLAALSDRDHGLPFDTVRLHGLIEPERAWLGDYTNVTNIGLYLIDIVAAWELDLIGPEEARTRLDRTLTTLERLETHHGFFFNYYDTTTLERTSNFLSFVDSAWLTAGLMVVRNSVPELAARCTHLIEREDYRFFYDPVEQLMMHGYYVHLPHRSEYSYGLLYSEARLGSLIAIGKGEAPVEHWYRMARTFPAHFDWQSQAPKSRADKTVNGFTFPGGYYSWKGLKYLPSWGGSLFEALMPLLVLDELRYAPASLGQNALAHTELSRRFTLEHLGYPVWGLSPSSTPSGDGYSEYGARVLGARGYPAGAVTPHAAALALLTEPAAATANLRQLAERYPLYGDFGFYDAVDPKTGQVAYNYLALDQSMILIALANHLRDGVIQKYFAADPIIQRVLPLLAAERFFD